jgi:hypothetical protein
VRGWRRGEDRVAALDGDAHPVVGDDVGDADQLHVVLQVNRVGHPLADHAVAVDRNADGGTSCH